MLIFSICFALIFSERVFSSRDGEAISSGSDRTTSFFEEANEETVLADICFVIDSSGSVGKENFETVKSFLADVVQSFEVGPSATQFAAIKFASYANVEFYLDSYHKKEDLIQTIRSILYIPGSSWTRSALQSARENCFGEYTGSRPEVLPAVLLITDGTPMGYKQGGSYLFQEAERLKKMGITVYCIGIGTETTRFFLEAICSETPVGLSYVWSVKTFDELHTLTDDTVSSIKQVAQPQGATTFVISTAPPSLSETTTGEHSNSTESRNSCSSWKLEYHRTLKDVAMPLSILNYLYFKSYLIS